MAHEYSERSRELASKLSEEACINLVERHGYTVWYNLETGKHEYLRPRVPVDNWNKPGYRRPGTTESNPQKRSRKFPEWVLALGIVIFLGGLALIFFSR